MSIQAVLLPLFVEVLLTFALLFWTGGVRVAAVRRREVHLRENFGAAGLVLGAEDVAELDRRFPPPQRPGAKAPLRLEEDPERWSNPEGISRDSGKSFPSGPRR